MTPEERAKEVWNNLDGGEWGGPSDADLKVIAAAIRAAVAEERERCAKVAEEVESRDLLHPEVVIAEAIRAENKP